MRLWSRGPAQHGSARAVMPSGGAGNLNRATVTNLNHCFAGDIAVTTDLLLVSSGIGQISGSLRGSVAMASTGMTLMALSTPITSRPGTFSSNRAIRAAGVPAPRMRTSRAHVVCAASSESAADRRAILGGLICATVAPAVVPHWAKADPSDLVLFQGTASPPTSYGGYGGNASEDFKYQLLVPGNWKPQVINKVEKGTQGIDCKFLNPDVKGMKVFVISLGRAGEDAKSFKITDTESTFAGFAGADYNIQDALSTADDITNTTREGEAKEVYYEYDINSPIFHYKASITTRRGKIFAMFLAAPGDAYEKQQPLMEEMIASFKAL